LTVRLSCETWGADIGHPQLDRSHALCPHPVSVVADPF
jgi:hypothetical protein